MAAKRVHAWQRYIPDILGVLRRLEEKTIIAVGVSPYPRVIPALFLKNYAIYTVKDTSDNDVLRQHAHVYCLEERFPKIAAKVHSTSYLLRNFVFQSFLKSRQQPYRLLFYQTTKKIVEILKEFGIEWIGNDPESFEILKLKGSFRQIVQSRNLPSIPNREIERATFLAMPFAQLWALWNRSFVVQRADFDVSGELGTFFINTETDWVKMHDILASDERYTRVTISPFIKGDSLSMLGCVTPKGVLTSTLQLQLIDVPESLHGQLATGVFLGHDWGFHDWPPVLEETAQRVVESLGKFLADRGYRGIFGIDFISDAATNEIFPIECNPRFTGALPVYSLMTLWQGSPPIELFHLMSNLGVDADFDFFAVNAALKKRRPLSHISLTPKGIIELRMPLTSGIFSFDQITHELRYVRPGAFPWECKSSDEFIIIDSVPRVGGRVIQNVPRLCKLIFTRRIAQSSFTVEPDIGEFITSISTALRQDQPAVDEQDTGGESDVI